MRLSELAKHLKANLVAPEGGPSHVDPDILGIAPIESAKGGYVSFVARPEFERFVPTTGASALIVKTAMKDFPRAQIIHPEPYYAYAKVAEIFFKPRPEFSGVSPQAWIDPSARLDETVTVFPFAYVGADVEVGAHTVLHSGVALGRASKIGSRCVIGANVAIGHGCRVGERVIIHAGAVIGADGFGFVPYDGEIAKIPQLGIVEIGDDVEIGAVTTIDRGALGATRIGRGTKLDSHVHVGHNVTVGENSMLCGMVGVAGSTKIGNWVVIGGNAGINGHIELGDRVQIGAMTGVTKTTMKPGQYIGFPAAPAGEWRRQQVHVRRLPNLEDRLKEMKEELEKLRKMMMDSELK